MMMMVGTFPVQAEFLAPPVGLYDEAFFSVLLRMAVPDTSFFFPVLLRMAVPDTRLDELTPLQEHCGKCIVAPAPFSLLPAQ